MSVSKNLPDDSSADHCDDLGFTTRILIQGLYPYKHQESLTRVIRSGAWKITLMASEGLPYGKYPRLIMAYIITQAVQRRHLPDDEARRIPLGSSINAFLTAMGISHRGTGGRQGTLKILREQLHRLSTSTLTVEHLGHPDRDSGAMMPIMRRWELWWSTSSAQDPLEDSWLELSEDFHAEIVAHPIPINLDILKALSRPRSMDVYLWATTRRHRLKAPLTLDWTTLQAQFGPDSPTTSRGRADFKKRFAKAVDEVLTLWPDAGLTLSETGLTLTPGRPSITPRRGH